MIAESTLERIAAADQQKAHIQAVARLLVDAKRTRLVNERPWTDLPDHRRRAYLLDAAYLIDHIPALTEGITNGTL